ncbi:heparan-alpha-glucosaminide N-acetyltransferase-like isoform X2 [Liolophura sinensis]|uniref:heparan-alpha-glucosaminide N-acetyltransferase-like isoform X2 n=1 Tax=Liolophura sinensis TaxID=3198878 RepID=UPI003159352C
MAAYTQNFVLIGLLNILLLYQALCLTGSSAQVYRKHKHKDGDIDTASLTVLNQPAGIKIQVLLQSAECHTCFLQPVRNISPGSNYTLYIDTRWPIRLAVNDPDNMDTYCAENELSQHFQEHGEYKLWVISNSSNSVICTGPILVNDPMDSNIPIYVALAILTVLASSWILLKYLHRKHYLYKLLCCFGTERLLDPVGMRTDLGIPPSINPGEDGGGDDFADKSKSSSRLKSLDTFRGISITIMVFVNYGGGGYWFFRHSKWNGLTVADLVFPWFVFIMGTALAISMRSQLRKGTSKRHICFRIIKRSIILFILGLLTNTGPNNDDLATLRIPGVLQRFAVTYLIVSLTHLVCAKGAQSYWVNWLGKVQDITDYWLEWIVQFMFVGTYLGLTFGLPVPGCPTGYLGAGGLSDGGEYENCTGGAAGYIDKWIFSEKHIYQRPTCQEVYNTGPYDPEGTLGTLNSFLMCFLGLQAGKIILIFKDYTQIVKRFLIWSVLLMAIAAVLCKVSKDDGWIPINKNLWSLSFVLLLAGFAFFLLTMCYLTIDVWKIWSGAPFFYPGMNSIMIYLGHELLKYHFPVNFKVPREHAQMTVMAFWGTTVFVVLSYVMYRKKLFLSI